MTSTSTKELRLVADIGGTNARFAMVSESGQLAAIDALKCDDYPHIYNAIEAYLQKNSLPFPHHAAIAVATPVCSDCVKLTNHNWTFSISELKKRLGVPSLFVVNDFTAQALAIPLLNPDQAFKFGGDEIAPYGNIAVIGPGTGLGVSGLVMSNNHWHPITGEGGHVSFYPTTSRGRQVIERIGIKYEHVSAERVLSGQGLVNIYNALCELENLTIDSTITPAMVTQKAKLQKCVICDEAINLFFDMLGTVAGDLVLTLGAQKGVYITGGIVPKVQDLFLASKFRQSFEAKGRFRSYLKPVPSYLVTYPYTALLGLCALFEKT